jgi:hypothetical protein
MRRQTLVVGIMNQSGAKEADFAIVCVASGETPADVVWKLWATIEKQRESKQRAPGS